MLIEWCVEQVEKEMARNKLSIQANQINVMTNVLFLIDRNSKRAILVAGIHEFIADKRFLHKDKDEQLDHFRRSMHLALFKRYPIDKNILWNLNDFSELDQYFNRNSRNNVLYKVRIKLRGKHKPYMGRKEDKQRVNDTIDYQRMKDDDLRTFHVPTNMRTLYRLVRTMGLRPDKRKLFLRKCNFALAQ